MSLSALRGTPWGWVRAWVTQSDGMAQIAPGLAQPRFLPLASPAAACFIPVALLITLAPCGLPQARGRV